MLSKRYTIQLADAETGARFRFTISKRGILLAAAIVTAAWTVPVLVGLGARWSAALGLEQLRAANHALQLENESYREVTGELTTQIASLQTMVAELGEHATTDPAQRKAIANLPALVRNRAMGGASPQVAARALSVAMGSPEDTFGVLRDLLGLLESRLQGVRTDVARWQALAGATPSIWPVIGWLSDGFGRRSDPFTGEAAQHLGLDISADKGQPVYATANGTVQAASYQGDFGNLVVITHEFGLTSRYAHMSRIAVKPGAVVQRGDVLGYVGSTGRSTAPHLHYEVWANGRPINPLRLLTSRPDR
jgi:murein DD-endopeptidase MepM/ murein hydrolase activator NlpD